MILAPHAGVWCLLALVGLLPAADLTTNLSIAAQATDGSPLTYGWQTVERPAGAGEPVIVGSGGSATASVVLPEPKAGDYRFQVVMAAEGLPSRTDTVVVTVRTKTAPGSIPSNINGGAGGGGCGQGAALGLLVGMAVFWRRGVRS